MIFDIQRFATKDGPGIRTLIFLKGCPLRCTWCANPESQSTEPEILFDSTKCRNCGRCENICPTASISFNEHWGLISKQESCKLCGACVDECYFDARRVSGKSLSAEQVMSIIRRDIPFFRRSSGGVTISGGEPLLQPLFLYKLLKLCKEEGIHTAIETSGYASWSDFVRILPLVDLVFFDLKHIDDSIHRKHTGVELTLILDNLRKVYQEANDVIVRIPVIPGFNHDISVMREIFGWLKNNFEDRWIELLPYHRLGISKYRSLGRQYAMEGISALKNGDLKTYQEAGTSMGLKVRIGPL